MYIILNKMFTLYFFYNSDFESYFCPYTSIITYIFSRIFWNKIKAFILDLIFNN